MNEHRINGRALEEWWGIKNITERRQTSISRREADVDIRRYSMTTWIVHQVGT